MKLIDYALILLLLLLTIITIILVSCQPQSSAPVGVDSGDLWRRDNRDLIEEVKSIDTLLDTFNLSDEHKEVARYLRKALVDTAKTYSNDTFYDLLSKLGAGQVKTIVNNMLDNHHLRLFYQASKIIENVQDEAVKKTLNYKLKETEDRYLGLLKDYSDINLTLAEIYSNLSEHRNGFNFKDMSSKLTEVQEPEVQRSVQEIVKKIGLIQDLQNTASSDEIHKVFTDYGASEPADQYGMRSVFSAVTYFLDGSHIHYSGDDAYSQERRKLVYLAFDYDFDDLVFFSAFFNKLIGNVNAGYYFTTSLGLGFEFLKVFSSRYYLSSFKTLREKRDDLVKLDYNDINTLHQQFVFLQEGKQKLVQIKDQIHKDYTKNVGLIRTSTGIPNAPNTLHEYLIDETRSYESRVRDALRKIRDADTNIIRILSKI
ncbi:BTA121 domain-containing protein surface lipoprotein [Borrelia persica]|uniref:BTA121 domain-containing protein surface lipoprotein n=1 Tax=Borrelia persica TaxID=44448 RepID=UPI000464D034|nr:CRASP family complement regulator-acquiring lipoprotein [Borrelia persica]